MKIDAVLVEHPLPWHIHKESGEVIDARGRYVMVSDEAVLELIETYAKKWRQSEQAPHS